jgi:hypothetical protein
MHWAGHPPLCFVHRLTLLLAAIKVSPDSGILLHKPHQPQDGSEGDQYHWCCKLLSGGLTLDYLSHVFGHIRVAEEFIVLPIIKMERGTVFYNPLWLVAGALGGPSDGGLIMGALL